MKFRLKIVKEARPVCVEGVFDHFSDRVEREIEVCEDSCCEAVVKVSKMYPDFIVVKWEEVDD